MTLKKASYETLERAHKKLSKVYADTCQDVMDLKKELTRLKEEHEGRRGYLENERDDYKEKLFEKQTEATRLDRLLTESNLIVKEQASAINKILTGEVMLQYKKQ